MAPSAWELQQDVSDFLSKVESDLRELARRQDRAKEDAGRWEEVQAVLARLQQHRGSIRQRSSAKGIDKATQSRLAAARAKIEEGARKARELEKRLKAGKSESPQMRPSTAASTVSPLSSAKATPEPPHATRRSGSASSEDAVSAAVAREAEAPEAEEVKVLAEQLLVDASAEGGDVVSEFVCKICQTHVVGCKPKLTRCSHLFCGDCISKWFAVQPGCQSWAGRAKGAGAVPCPVCKEPLRENEDLHPVCKGGQGGSAFLWQMLSATRIVCANHPRCSKEGCCDWEGEYGAYQQHIRSCTNTPGYAPKAVPAAAASPAPAQAPAPAVGGDEAAEAEATEEPAVVAADGGVGDVSDGEAKDASGSPPPARARASSSDAASAVSWMAGASDSEAATTVPDSEAEGAAAVPEPKGLLKEEEAPEAEFYSDDDDDDDKQSSSAADIDSPVCEVAAPFAAEDAGIAPQQQQEPDLYSLIAQLVELKASAPQAPPAAEVSAADPPGGAAAAESEASSGFEEEQQQPPATKQTTSSGNDATTAAKSAAGGKKSAAATTAAAAGKPKDGKAKASTLQDARQQAQAAHLQALQAQAAHAHAHAAQWQAAWQMQAAQAAQWQQAQARMAYAGRMAQWQAAQVQAAQAAWSMHATQQ